MNRLVALALLVSTTALAVPTTMPHQGRLFDSAGTPLSGDQSLTFTLYDGASGGAALWTETQANVPHDNGYFATSLGETTPLDSSLFEDGMLYLALKVGSEPELPTRLPLRSVPFAFRAASADHADTADHADSADNATGDITPTSISINGNTIVDSSGTWVGTAPTPDLAALVSSGDLATVATTGDYADLANTPSLAAVATTGDYADLTNTPSLAAVATTGDYADLANTPGLAAVATTGDYADLANTPSLAAVATSNSYNDLDDKPVIAGPNVQYFRGRMANRDAIINNDSGYMRLVTEKSSDTSVFSEVTTGNLGLRFNEAGTIMWAFDQDVISSGGNYVYMRVRVADADNYQLIRTTDGRWDGLVNQGVAHVEPGDVMTILYGSSGANITSLDQDNWSNYSIMWIAD